LKFIVALVLNVSTGGRMSGAGMFARWTTLSEPLRTSTVCP